MTIKLVRLDNIRPYAGNPRVHDDRSIQELAASIRDYGFRVPVLLDRDLTIIAGHGRYAAAKRLGMAEVPAIIAGDLTPEQVAAYRLVDNAAHEWSSWDPAKLDTELAALGAVASEEMWHYFRTYADIDTAASIAVDTLARSVVAEQQKAAAGITTGPQISGSDTAGVTADWAAAGMPEFDCATPQHPYRSVIVYFATAESVDAFCAALERPKLNANIKRMWYPGRPVKTGYNDDDEQ